MRTTNHSAKSKKFTNLILNLNKLTHILMLHSICLRSWMLDGTPELTSFH